MAEPIPQNPDQMRETNDTIKKKTTVHYEASRSLGVPEWTFSAFQRLRRLVEMMSDNPRYPQYEDVRERIEEILGEFPSTFFSYDDQIMSEFKSALERVKTRWGNIENTDVQRPSD